MNSPEITTFLTHLAVEGNVAAATQNQALNALVFLYKQVLKIELRKIEDVVRAPQRRKLPVVLTREETEASLAHLSHENRLLASLLYGSGLRLMEAVHLPVKDIDLARNEIVVRDGKGEKDRVTMLPQSIIAALRIQLDTVKRLHGQDLKRGGGEVYMPHALERKYPTAATEFNWQYLFPVARLSVDPRSAKRRRHHLNELNLQRAIKKAVAEAGVRKNATSHSFRHSLTHGLRRGLQIFRRSAAFGCSQLSFFG